MAARWFRDAPAGSGAAIGIAVGSPWRGLDQEAGVTADGVRARDRWHGWAWLAVAIVSPAFFVGTHAALLSRAQHFLVALAFGTIGLVLWIVEARRGGLGEKKRRIDGPVTLAYVVLMFVVASIAILWDPMGPPAWFVLASLLPSVPCAVGAWRILR